MDERLSTRELAEASQEMRQNGIIVYDTRIVDQTSVILAYIMPLYIQYQFPVDIENKAIIIQQAHLPS